MYMSRRSDVAREVQKRTIKLPSCGACESFILVDVSVLLLFQMNLCIRVINLLSLGFRCPNGGSRLSPELIGGVGFVRPLRHGRLYGRSRAYYTESQFLDSAVPLFGSSCMPRRQRRETAGGSPASY